MSKDQKEELGASAEDSGQAPTGSASLRSGETPGPSPSDPSRDAILKAVATHEKFLGDLLEAHNLPRKFSYRRACDIGYKAGVEAMTGAIGKALNEVEKEIEFDEPPPPRKSRWLDRLNQMREEQASRVSAAQPLGSTNEVSEPSEQRGAEHSDPTEGRETPK